MKAFLTALSLFAFTGLASAKINVDGQQLPLVLLRRGTQVLALGATCSHWGGPLAEGNSSTETVSSVHGTLRASKCVTAAYDRARRSHPRPTSRRASETDRSRCAAPDKEPLPESASQGPYELRVRDALPQFGTATG